MDQWVDEHLKTYSLSDPEQSKYIKNHSTEKWA